MMDGGPDPFNPHDLMENAPLRDVYADGIAMVEPLSGDNCRITYFTYQRIPGAAALTRVVCARIIRHRSTLVAGQITAMLERWPREHVQTEAEQPEGAV